jgi:hypothetical protein
VKRQVFRTLDNHILGKGNHTVHGWIETSDASVT